jgi:nucleotide-binding universal stress UspA family protein
MRVGRLACDLGVTRGTGSVSTPLQPRSWTQARRRQVFDTAPQTNPGADFTGGRSVFARVIAGVDGSEPGFEACRQAGRLVEPDGWLEVFSAVYLVGANLAGWSAARIADELWQEGGEAIEKAKMIVGPRAESRLVNGPGFESIMREIERERATLVVVGTHGHSRISEIMIGGVAGELLHEAPCSVLVARPPAAEAIFPRAIVAGIDGSRESEVALATAEYLAQRFAVELGVVTAVGGKDVDLAHARLRAPSVAKLYAHPVPGLVEAGRNVDLLVAGSRGLHGIRALGSVSERVAHRAPCSVLVVRGPG